MSTLLDLTIADIMNRSVRYVSPDCTLGEVARQMAEAHISSMLVMSGQTPLGIITERDLLRFLSTHAAKEITVAEAMSAPVLTVSPGTDFGTAYATALGHHVRHLVVVDERGSVVGMASETDFRRHLGMGVLRQLDDLETLMDSDLPILSLDDTLGNALNRMLRDRASYVLVAEEGRPVGILTERDIAGLLVSIPDGLVDGMTMRDVAHNPVLTVSNQTSVFDVAHLMQERQYRHMAVVDNGGRILGMVTLHNLMERIASLLGHEKNLRQQDRLENDRRIAEQRLLMAVEATGLGFWELELPAQNLGYNDTLLKVLGLRAEESPRNLDEWLERVHPEDRPMLMSSYSAALQPESGGIAIDVEYRVSHKAEQWIWMHVQGCVAQRDTAGRPTLAIGTAMNINARKQAEIALQQSEANLKRAQAVAKIGSWHLDVERNTLEWSDETYRMFGIPNDRSMNYESFLDQAHPADRAVLESAWSTALGGAPYHIEHRIVVKDEIRWVEERAELQFDTAGKCLSAVGTAQDITDRKRDQERMEFLAHFDALTGLPNHAQLEDRLKYAISLAKRGNGQLAVIFLDLDRFKNINDTLGHSVGDILLVELSKRLCLTLREEDTVSRMGGDEFILLLPDTDADGSAQVANKILEVVTQPFQLEGNELSVTASIGIAVYPNDGADMDALSRNADAAMYNAKFEGRNCYRFFAGEMQARTARNLQLANALRHALERDQLRLHYQPQIAMQNGRLIGAEALLRWRHPELGTVPPAEFIPVAEDCGLILSIGEWVLRNAVQQARIWQESGLDPMVIAVNLSAIQFGHADLPELISRILAEAELPAEYLELELTEGVAMRDPHAAITIMNRLHECGVRMSIDDFGTGYSSLSYLKKFKVYKLKIDQSFIRDISTDAEDKAIVGAIIQMSKSLGLMTIAEGVETPGQLAFLREQGCDEVQGYYHSKPLPADQFEAFARARGNGGIVIGGRR